MGLAHSGGTGEANCSWLHPVWPPPKRPDQDSTFCTAFTELNFCIHQDFEVMNNVCKPRRLVCECWRDMSAWKSRVMKPTVLRDPGRMKATEYRDEANWSRTGLMKPTADNSVALTSALETHYACNGWIWAIGTCIHKFSHQLGLHPWVCKVGEYW